MVARRVAQGVLTCGKYQYLFRPTYIVVHSKTMQLVGAKLHQRGQRSCLLQKEKVVLGSHLFQLLPQFFKVGLSLLKV